MATLLKPALNNNLSKGSIWLCAVLGLLFFSACSHYDRQVVDKLNHTSYAYHYRNLDSTEVYARRALAQAEGYQTGRAEALNHLAFVHIARMEYAQADSLLDEIVNRTDNQLQLFVAYVQQMRLCQRRSRNREFHEFRELANRALQRIREEEEPFPQHDADLLLYAESEYAIVNSTYYYYVGLERQSVEALHQINPDVVIRDTAQYLNYLYNIGAGGIITKGTQEEINQQEFDHLLHCFMLARQGDYPYFAANALEAISEHLSTPAYRRRLIEDNLPAMKFLNPIGVDDEMLAGFLAENSLFLFEQYGDVYQIAGAYRTLASCFRQIGDYESALFNLEKALVDSAIYQAPDLVASIREQLSVAYSAIDDKAQSDYNRNLYLDLQETTRQDRELEARASQYEKTAVQLNVMIAAVIGAIVLLFFSLWFFNKLNRKHTNDNISDDLFEQLSEELKANQLRVENNERLHLEQRAKISLVNSITPLIDRILYEVSHPDTSDKIAQLNETRTTYVRELTDQINDYNDVLTYWIQLRQGELSLKIETFPLQQIFDMLAKGKTAYQMKGINLMIEPTQAVVKADKVLTLFMLNTLADNARKFSERDGRISVSATDTDNYVEIAVEDTGKGMTDYQLQHLFENKPILQDTPQTTSTQHSHGFGLLNCKGIIDKYRKISQIFSVCTIAATSRLGEGTRVFFRLPKGIVRLLVLLFSLAPLQTLSAQNALERAAVFADSAYFSNINGRYEQTIRFADSCRYHLNQHYLEQYPKGRYLMRKMGNPSLLAPEIKWFHDSLKTNYHIILDIRNESAIAALALHQWEAYTYNNRIYTQLFKEMSADNTLGEYCRTMQQSQTNKTIAIILLVLMLIAIIPAYYLLYYRHRLYDRFLKEQQRQTDLELLKDKIRKAEYENNNLHVSNAVLDNCLSTLKHETMYYPSRIRQLLDTGDIESLGEVTTFYRELYGMLSQQAMRQVEHIRLHLQPLADHILGDESLIRYLFEILRKQSGQKKLEKHVTLSEDGQYAEVVIPMPALRLTETQAAELFTPSKENIPYLLCRQIVRDHGEATNRRSCGIMATIADGITQIRIILPATKQIKQS